MDKEENRPDGNEDENDLFAPEGGAIDWGNTDPEVIFGKRDQAWEIRTGEPMSIWCAAYTGNVWRIRRHMEKGADINAYADGRTAVHFAAENGKLDSINMLVEEGADIDAKDMNGDTAAHIASAKGHREMVRLLVDEGADVNLKNNEGQTVMDVCIKSGQTEIRELLRSQHGTFNSICGAAKIGNKEEVMGFLRLGADIEEVEGVYEMNALLWAASRGHVGVVELLVEKGANPNAKDSRGWTSLHYSAIRGVTAIIRLLIGLGVEINRMTNDDESQPPRERNKTPLDLARLRDNREAIDLLRKHGGKTGEELKTEGK